MRRPSIVLLALCLAASEAVGAGAQTPPTLSPLSFRNQLDLQVLGTASHDFSHAPSFRLTFQHRRSLDRSTIFSGLLLFDPLSNSVGLTVGQRFGVGDAARRFEPFVEGGLAYLDARVPTRSYEVVGTGGSAPLRTVQRYRAVRGSGLLAGAGMSWTGGSHGRVPVRFTVGYWQILGGSGFRHGSLRVGVSLGWASGQDRRWYTLASDRTPPTTVVVGQNPPMRDSIEVSQGRIRILASDANGIASVQVNGRGLDFRPADPISARDFGLVDEAVASTAAVRLPLDGGTLAVAVRDSAGRTTRSVVRAFPAPDREPPTVSVVTSEADVDTPTPTIQARADDLSGIAYARIGMCPVGLERPSDAVDGGQVNPTLRLIDGHGAPDEDGLQLEVWDRVGNLTRTSIPPRAPRVSAGAATPELTGLTATVGSRGPKRTSVRIRGTVSDPAGGWITGVAVDGQPAVLRVGRRPSRVSFDGWLVVGAGTRSVTAVATTADGRTVRRSVPIESAARAGVGQLYTLIVLPEASPGRRFVLDALARRAGESRPMVLTGSGATPEAVLDSLSSLTERVGPEDAVLVYVEGSLTADQTAPGPSVDLGAGRLALERLGHALRGLHAGVTLVSTGFRPGRTWTVLPSDVPGASPPAGCYEDGVGPQGAILDAGFAEPERILTALAGDADRDRDGRVLTTELLSYLGVAPRSGLLPFDPLLTLKAGGDDP